MPKNYMFLLLLCQSNKIKIKPSANQVNTKWKKCVGVWKIKEEEEETQINLQMITHFVT